MVTAGLTTLEPLGRNGGLRARNPSRWIKFGLAVLCLRRNLIIDPFLDVLPAPQLLERIARKPRRSSGFHAAVSVVQDTLCLSLAAFASLGHPVTARPANLETPVYGQLF